MTVNELIELINNEVGYQKPVPETLIVNAETYSLVCYHLVKRQCTYPEHHGMRVFYPIIGFGKHGGVMFKNIELLTPEMVIESVKQEESKNE